MTPSVLEQDITIYTLHMTERYFHQAANTKADSVLGQVNNSVQYSTPPISCSITKAAAVIIFSTYETRPPFSYVAVIKMSTDNSRLPAF